MNKITIRKLAVTLAAAVIIPAVALAQGPGPEDQDGPDGHMGQMGMMHGGMGMHRGMHRGQDGMGFLSNPEMRKQLGITDEQAAKIRQQALDFRKAQIRTRADLEVKRLDLHSLMAADNPDRAAIDKSLQEVGAAQMALEKSRIDFHLAMRASLSPEQREKLKHMREQFGHGGERGPGGMHGMMRHGGMMEHGPEGAPPPPSQQ